MIQGGTHGNGGNNHICFNNFDWLDKSGNQVSPNPAMECVSSTCSSSYGGDTSSSLQTVFSSSGHWCTWASSSSAQNADYPGLGPHLIADFGQAVELGGYAFIGGGGASNNMRKWHIESSFDKTSWTTVDTRDQHQDGSNNDPFTTYTFSGCP